MKEEKFLDKWDVALKAYGTPRDFASSTNYERRIFTLDGKDYPLICAISRSEQKRELMKQQKHYTPKRKIEEYGLRLNLEDCFLCENIVQAVDSAYPISNIRNNLIFQSKRNFVMPNRYPIDTGHSLIVPRDHDNMIKRIIPKTDEYGEKLYLPEKGKTRGAVITDDVLAEIFEISDENGFKSIRNHVLDGMSIPGHDHWHTFIANSPPFLLLESLLQNTEKTSFGNTIYKIKNTPFDTLLIRGGYGEKIVATSTKIIKKMEESGIVFTLLYNGGRLLITPRRPIDRSITIGGGSSAHYFFKKDGSDVELAKKAIYLKGQFNWENFLN